MLIQSNIKVNIKLAEREFVLYIETSKQHMASVEST